MLDFISINAFQREILIRFILVAFCLGLWFGILYSFIVVLLVLAWVMDDGLQKSRQLIKDPLVQALGIFCILLLLGLFWSETFLQGRDKWTKYFLLLTYIPFLGLLTRQRLPWVIGAVVVGYVLVLLTGLYAWQAEQQQGIPVLNMTYLTFSAMLGVGCVLLCCCAMMSHNRIVQITLVSLALLLLYFQFHQNARGFLLATMLTVMIIFITYFRVSFKKIAVIVSSLLLAVTLFSVTSPVVSERWKQATLDFEHIQQGNYSNSIGYRIALWDVGLHGILEKPLLGHGTGTPEHYFDQTILHYKNGIYAKLPLFQQTSHYHNDWMEMGMQLGALGILSLMYLLWAWFWTFKKNCMVLPGIAMVSFIVLSGMTETFLIFARMPVFLLVMTAIAVCWQKEQSTSGKGHYNG